VAALPERRLTPSCLNGNDLAFSPNGSHLATTGADRTVRLWAMPSGKPIAILTGHTDAINDIAFSPDGSRLTTAGGDNTARLWNMPSGKLVTTLTGHTAAVYAIAFTPGGTRRPPRAQTAPSGSGTSSFRPIRSPPYAPSQAAP